jgi:predicted ABC-type ATPase
MFAGPNGSGKSELKAHLPEALLGLYLNPDEIEAEIKSQGYTDFSKFDIITSVEEIFHLFERSELLRQRGLDKILQTLRFEDGKLYISADAMDSYVASVLVEFMRSKLLEARQTFTFETVMSHPSKVQVLRMAQELGYRTYLYYVATDDSAINVSRVANRVALGGHSVPVDKIVMRYQKSLALLLSAIRYSSRAYIFDNSTNNAAGTHTWLAEITDGKTLKLMSDQIPAWFQHSVMDKIA